MSRWAYNAETGQESFVAGDTSFEMIANEETSPAGNPHAVGERFIYNGVLYKAKTAIAVDDALVVGTNIELADTLEEQIEDVEQATANEVITRSKLGAHNLLPLDLAVIKTNNTSGTWSGSKYTYNNVEFTINTDSDGNITSVNVNTIGTVSSDSMLVLSTKSFGNSNISTYGNISTVNGYTISGGENVSSSVVNLRVAYNKYNTSIYVEAGSTISNKLVYPMIRLESDPNTAFEPYAMTNAEITNKITDGIIMESVVSNENTIAGGGTGTIAPSISKSGYKALGIVGIHSFSSNLMIYEFMISTNGAAAYVGVKNTGSSPVTGSLTVDVLYKKS